MRVLNTIGELFGVLEHTYEDLTASNTQLMYPLDSLCVHSQ